MNPSKKKEMIDKVIMGYTKYRTDLLEFFKSQQAKPSSLNPNESPDEYYNKTAEDDVIRVKPNIYYYLDKYERRVLKKILEKKPGYEKVNLNRNL